jgi:hypothetical protein
MSFEWLVKLVKKELNYGKLLWNMGYIEKSHQRNSKGIL